MSALSSLLSVCARFVGAFADLLQPLFHSSATAAAIVLLTLCVRLAVHPLARAAARGQRARARLAPRIAELRARYAKDPARLRSAMLELHAEERVSPLTGCLPNLLQMPAFFLMYRLFDSRSTGGRPNPLLDHALLGAPLGDRWFDVLAHGGVFGTPGLVFAVLFAVVAAVATATYRRTKAQTAGADPAAAPGAASGVAPGVTAGVGRLLPLVPFLTLITVAVVPLAAALYVVTSTTWTAVERRVLYRDAAPAPASGASA